MATTNRALLDHSPIHWASSSEAAGIVEYVEKLLCEHFGELAELAGRAQEDDELEPLREQTQRRLLQFLALCRAQPLRSANKLIATLRHIAKKPKHFSENPSGSDPEAVSRLCSSYMAHAASWRLEWLNFETGIGTLP